VVQELGFDVKVVSENWLAEQAVNTLGLDKTRGSVEEPVKLVYVAEVAPVTTKKVGPVVQTPVHGPLVLVFLVPSQGSLNPSSTVPTARVKEHGETGFSTMRTPWKPRQPAVVAMAGKAKTMAARKGVNGMMREFWISWNRDVLVHVLKM
jgi:hypothetical protein